MPEADVTLDTSGMLCPLPVIKTRKKMDELKPGQVLEVIATDKGSLADIPAWASKSGNQLLEQKEEGGKYYYYIKKA